MLICASQVVCWWRGTAASVADAYFVLKDSNAPEDRQYTPFLLEADRSTMDLAGMKAKQANYALMFTEGHYQEKFNVHSSPALGYAVARVLTVTYQITRTGRKPAPTAYLISVASHST